MANALGIYNPIFYAQEALIQLEAALGMAGRVHRGIEKERGTAGKGDVINIRRPTSFTVNDAPATATDLAPDTVALTLNQWREVKFQLTDKELTISEDRIISDHIRPAAVALADDIDTKLAALYKDIPWFEAVAAPMAVSDFTNAHQTMFDNKVPQNDGGISMMLDGQMQNEALQLSAFTQQQGAGDQGVQSQMRGTLGTKFGMEVFANQNVQSHTRGTASVTAVLTNGTPALGANELDLDASSLTGTVVPGDTFVIAGNTQRYAITNTVTASSNAMAAVQFVPGLAAAPGDGAAITLTLVTGTNGIAFHKNAFALAMAPLSEMGNELGAKIATVNDPITNLAIRSRLFYIGDSSKVVVALDVLFGVKTLDPNLAVNMHN